MATHRLLAACLVGVSVGLAPTPAAEPLPDTKPLTDDGDLAAKMVAGMHKYLDAELSRVFSTRGDDPLALDHSTPEALGRTLRPHQDRLRKMLGEERYHFLHGRSWLDELGPTPAVERAWEEAVEWFGPDGGELRVRLARKLERPDPELEIDWSRWDPVRRRTREGAIDRHTFDMLRGLEEKRYGITKAESPARG